MNSSKSPKKPLSADVKNYVYLLTPAIPSATIVVGYSNATIGAYPSWYHFSEIWSSFNRVLVWFGSVSCGGITVQASEHEIRRRRSFDPQHPARRTRVGQFLHERPHSRIRTFTVLVRAEATPLLALSFAIGAILAWWETGRVDALALSFGILGAICAGWAFYAISAYLTDQYNRTAEAKSVQDPLYTGFGLIRRGLVPSNMVRDLGLMLLVLFGVCILWLTLLAGWPMVFFSVLGLLFGAAVLLLPFIRGYRGWGISHLGTMVILGALPLLSGYYGQAHALSASSLWLAGMFALVFGLVQYNYDAIHVRRDWLIGKPTLAVNLGSERVRDVSTLLTLSVYVVLLAAVTLTDIPLLALLALIALPVALNVFEPLQLDEVTSDDCVSLYSSALYSSALAGLLICFGLIVDMTI